MVATLTAFFQNNYQLLLIIYEGLLLLVGGVLLVSVLKELIPAMMDSRKKESPEFKEKVSSLIRGIVIFVLAALAPIWVPLLVHFFGGASGFETSSNDLAKTAPLPSTGSGTTGQ